MRALFRGEMFDFIVAQKRVAEPQACKFFHQIIDGIEVLHKNEITHRDLKPEVTLLYLKICDALTNLVDTVPSESAAQSNARRVGGEDRRFWSQQHT